MKENKVSINIISSFNNANFSGLLKSSKNFSWSINELGYNQVFQTLTNSNSKIWKKRRNITLIWTTPESISSEFKKLENGNIINPNKIKDEVEYFCSCVESVKKYSDIVLIPNWILKQQNEDSLTLSHLKNSSLKYNLSLMNQCLYEKFYKAENLYILNSSKWLTNCGSIKAYNSKLWYLMKNPFSNDFFKEAILDLENLYTSIKGQNKKLLILDLDNTLWGGIVGDVGWKNLRLGGHDHLGEAFQDFQTKIKSLSKNGLLLALASKNDEAVAIEAIEKHPEMILSMNDFVTHKINWDDKAKNISEIVDELNIGLQSVVFFDDSPAERDRVKKTLPEVFVPELPKDPTDYFAFLSKLRCFDTTHISAEDKVRGKLYKVENKRTSLKKKIKSLSQWIETLELEILIENIKKENKPRCLQLLNKTNQMNLSTRRLNEQEFVNWINKNSNYLWTVRAKDKFGDYGIIGILSLSMKDKVVHIVDFILSCRVVGRCIENVLIEFVKDFCRHNKISKINGKYKKTKKNSLIYEFLKKLNIINENKSSFIILSKKNNVGLPKIKVTKPSLRKR
jgi:FkbH-like protein